MSDIKNDHSIGAGAGAVAGAVAGAAVGSVAGPVGTMVGAIAGGVAGAKAGDAIAEAVNPTVYDAYFQRRYRDMPYYSTGREWRDYQPAYRYGYDAYGRYRGHRFEEVEDRLERDWEHVRGRSRLAWAEARDAVRDGWRHLERAFPGDMDRDGR